MEKDTGSTGSAGKKDDRRRFGQHLHLNIRHNMTVKGLCCEVKECTRKHSESGLPGLKSAELQDVLPARLLVGRSHTPVSANYCKISGKRVDARRQRRRCNVVLFEFNRCETWYARVILRIRLIRWMRTLLSEHLPPLDFLPTTSRPETSEKSRR